MKLTSNDLLACKDYCISDAGENCLKCERLHKTVFIQMLIEDKLTIVNKEEKEIKDAEDLILEKKSELINEIVLPPVDYNLIYKL